MPSPTNRPVPTSSSYMASQMHAISDTSAPQGEAMYTTSSPEIAKAIEPCSKVHAWIDAMKARTNDILKELSLPNLAMMKRHKDEEHLRRDTSTAVRQSLYEVELLRDDLKGHLDGASSRSSQPVVDDTPIDLPLMAPAMANASEKAEDTTLPSNTQSDA
ncbi:hypothetical protein H5410_051339 [Solanum commersonii]|uniref:Uncharacterized protein n=1 Tax=Solanum commersonii TaxID=4109 RepID=A0A9J5X0N4_SOLCO|nr:hypothetical protein H5410_051339 [Solanum commersonii]